MAADPAKTPGNRLLPHILAALLAASAPHVIRLPIWIFLWMVVLWGVALGAAQGRWSFPKPVLRQVLTLAGVVIGMAWFRFSFNLDVGVGILGIMLGLKPLEIRTHRDRMITLFLGYFMVITNLLYSNALGITLYMFVAVWVITAVLIRINHGGEMKRHLKTSVRIMAQAIPLAICLFVLFPRLQGGLWGRPRNVTGTTGFSTQLEPGSIIEIVEDPSIAFRVEFDGAPPQHDRLYWRGLIFRNFDGRKWTQGGRSIMPVIPASGTTPVTTTIILEPHHQRWLFALDMPVKNPSGTWIMEDHTLFSRRRVRTIFQYRVTSFINYEAKSTASVIKTMLALPAEGNQKSRELARSWAAETSNPDEIVQKALSFFRDNRFQYSLISPLLGKNVIDDFLFSSQKGYCEHYASAMAFLMRAAGIPARIVGGYLGGEKNPYGDYYIVRQSDAHAWVEVWLGGRGWVRIDPTSIVAPARLSQGMMAALAPEERQAFEPLSQLGPMAKYWRAVDFGWDLFNNRWNKWVLGYSFDRQREVYSRIGIDFHGWKAPLAAVFLLAVFAGFYGGWLAFVSRKRATASPSAKPDEVQKLYGSFCKKMATIGIPKDAALGPADYCRMILSSRPDLAGEVRKITRYYIQLRYGRSGEALPVKPFKSAVKQFRPGKQPSISRKPTS